MKTYYKVIVLLSITIATMSLACQTDFECGIGAHCIKQGWNPYGICTSQNQYQPQLPNPFGSNNAPRPTNQFCQTDFQCGIGFSCVKQIGQLYGVCE